jgi:hypothetical protein
MDWNGLIGWLLVRSGSYCLGGLQGDYCCCCSWLLYVCESEEGDFKRDYAKENLMGTWDSASLRTKTLAEIKEKMGLYESKARL